MIQKLTKLTRSLQALGSQSFTAINLSVIDWRVLEILGHVIESHTPRWMLLKVIIEHRLNGLN